MPSSWWRVSRGLYLVMLIHLQTGLDDYIERQFEKLEKELDVSKEG